MKNKKGFTLIELLAVIVILALLVAVAIPAVTKYLNSSRKGVFADNAAAAISAVRNQTIIDGITGTQTYDLGKINELLEKKLIKSPWASYKEASVTVTENNGVYAYKIFLTDGQHCIGKKNGTTITEVEEKDVTADAVKPTSSDNPCGTYSENNE